MPNQPLKTCKYLTLTFLSLYTISALAQPKMQFEKKVHDFGEVEESSLYVYHKFEFTNTGNRTLIIKTVETSCGCTSPEWTQDSVFPGRKGYVQARFETKNRVGMFNKTLTVYSNAENPFEQLDILGTVKASKNKVTPATGGPEVSENFGFVFFEPQSFDLGKINDRQTDTQLITVSNESDYIVAMETPVFTQNCFTTENFPAVLNPHESAKFKLILNGNKVPYFGPNGCDIGINTSHPTVPNYALKAYYHKTEYFPKYSKKQLKKQAHAQLDKKVIKFDSVVAGDILNANFVLTNTGKMPLKIRQILPSCGCVTARITKQELQPGEKMNLLFVYDTIQKNGNASQKIQLVTNDPVNPEIELILELILPEHKQKCMTCGK